MVDVSIIVPTYNSASHLDRCLGSIGAQKDIRAELHVIDDNSKDDTQQKVLAFKQHNPHVDVHLHVRLEDRSMRRASTMPRSSSDSIMSKTWRTARAAMAVRSGWRATVC